MAELGKELTDGKLKKECKVLKREPGAIARGLGDPEGFNRAFYACRPSRPAAVSVQDPGQLPRAPTEARSEPLRERKSEMG